jgi:hypothetical protein
MVLERRAQRLVEQEGEEGMRMTPSRASERGTKGQHDSFRHRHRIRQIHHHPGLFAKWIIKNMSASDCLWLRNYDTLAQNIFVLSSDNASACNASSNIDIDWPIIWTIARHHKKHRIIDTRCLSKNLVEDALVKFESKIKWSWYFRDRYEDPRLTMYRLKLIKKKTTPTCPHFIDPEIREWLRIFKSNVMEGYNRAHVQACRNKFSNASHLAKWARVLFANSKLKLMQTDKDGGFLLLYEHQLNTIYDGIFSLTNKSGQRIYRPTSFQDKEWLYQPDVYRGICLDIEKYEDLPGLAKVICKSLVSKRIFATLKVTAKTHKSPFVV